MVAALRSFGALAIVMLVTGCAPKGTIALRAVDALSEQPLADVQVSRHSFANSLLNTYTERTALGKTGVDGQVVAAGLRKDSLHEITFHKEGYHDAFVGIGTGNVLTDVVSVVNASEQKHRSTNVGKLIIVPMYPVRPLSTTSATTLRRLTNNGGSITW